MGVARNHAVTVESVHAFRGPVRLSPPDEPSLLEDVDFL